MCFRSVFRSGDPPSREEQYSLGLVDQGLPEAHFELGMRYEHGFGVEKNEQQAAAFYRLAADQGYVRAQYNLALMYDTGQGVPENNTEAVRWYRAAGHHAKAKHNLKVMYADGRAVPEGEDEDGDGTDFDSIYGLENLRIFEINNGTIYNSWLYLH